MQLFTEPFLITRAAGRAAAPRRSAAALPAGLHCAEFRLCLGDRLHDGGPGGRVSLHPDRPLRGSSDEPASSTNGSVVAAPAPVAAGADLAVPLWMMAIFSTMPETASSARRRAPAARQFRRKFQHLQRDTDFVGRSASRLASATYTFLSVLLTSMAGWALARYQFFGKGVDRDDHPRHHHPALCVVVIPQFIMVARDFKLANTWVALIVPPLFNSLGVLFMRQSFSMCPGDCSTPRASRASRNGASSCMSRCRWRGRRWRRSPSSCSCPPGTIFCGRC